MSRRKRFYYATFILLFFLVAIEITGRIYLHYFLKKSTSQKFRFNSYRIYEHVPGFTEGNNNTDWIKINQQGFRQESEVAIPKPENTLRIFFMGASAAHGISSAAPFPIRNIYMHQTIDAYLEKLLQQKFPNKKVEVINAAVTGYQFFQQTNYLLEEIINYNPDLVIFFDGANDCYINNPTYKYFDGNKFQFWNNRLQEPSLFGIFDYTMLWCSKFSGFARGYLSWKGIKEAEKNQLKYERYKSFVSTEILSTNHKLAAKRTWLPLLQTNFSILKQHNIKTIFALQPMLVLRNDINKSATEISFNFKDDNCLNTYQSATTLLDSLTKTNKINYIDFVPAFNNEKLKSKQLFIDYCHLTPLGNYYVAKVLEEKVEREITNRIK